MMSQESGGSAILFILWACWIYWLVSARIAQASSETKPSEKIGGQTVVNRGRPALEVVDQDSDQGRQLVRNDGVSEREVANALIEIQQVDSAFSTEEFLKGASSAYEEITMAFASGNRATLETFVTPEVFTDFNADITERERRGERTEVDFVRIAPSKIVRVHRDQDRIGLSVRFLSELFSVTRNKSGAIIGGSLTTSKQAVDVWMFEKPSRSSSRDWKLSASNNLEAGA